MPSKKLNADMLNYLCKQSRLPVRDVDIKSSWQIASHDQCLHLALLIEAAAARHANAPSKC